MTQTEIPTEKDLLISLTIHNFPAEMIKEFAQKIVRPYFSGNLNQAIRTLMENAVIEETITRKALSEAKRKISNEFGQS
jgi:ferritin-like protein